MPTLQTALHPEKFLRRHRAARGFTLIEVVAAMALMVFLMGSVYAVADGTLRLSTSLSRSRTAEARINHFMSQWRSCLENLGPDTKLSATNDGRTRVLFLENGHAAFAWNRAARSAAAVRFAFDSETRALTVEHLKKSQRAAGQDFYTIAALPLVEGLQDCSWQFFDPVTNDWADSWDHAERLPKFMRLRCEFAGQAFPVEGTFWISGSAANTAPEKK